MKREELLLEEDGYEPLMITLYEDGSLGVEDEQGKIVFNKDKTLKLLQLLKKLEAADGSN